jgi:hypothetical protein
MRRDKIYKPKTAWNLKKYMVPWRGSWINTRNTGTSQQLYISFQCHDYDDGDDDHNDIVSCLI